MATYAIGDIHGCFDEFQALLCRLDFQPGRDALLLTGDLINRGPKSLAMLRWARRRAGAVRFVLGNHELHLIACALGVGRAAARDTIGEILTAPDGPALVSWLRAQPLLIREEGLCLVHAGLHPDWTLDEAEARARATERLLRGKGAAALVCRDAPKGASQDKELEGARQSIALFTRLRACREGGAMDEHFTGPLAEVPKSERAWFDWPSPRDPSATIAFGHWAALGAMIRPNLIALDSGCVWKRCLSALRLGDRALFQQPFLSNADTTRP